jgi:NADH dehydrogenase
MSQKIIVVGSGFAGLWAAISASRAIALAGKEADVEVIVVSPSPTLTIRPRLYEAVLDNMTPDISAVLDAIGASHIRGTVEGIAPQEKTILVRRNDGRRQTLEYDRLVLATGSQLYAPAIPGLKEYSYNVDTFQAAEKLDAHLKSLVDLPPSAPQRTVVVAGGGFTGLEAATEMPERLRAIFGAESGFRIVVVDPASEIGAEMGVSAVPVVREALDDLGIERRTGVRVEAIDAGGVTLSSGERIESATVIWAAGMRAQPLAALVPGEHDHLGRVVGDAYLRAPAADGIFVAGDAVRAATDELGNYAVMSCQHALSLGRIAGNNAAAELVGLPIQSYAQPKYVTCLDLGSWGALYTEGWDRQVRYVRDEAKKLKQEINRVWIYPPAVDRDAILALGSPDFVVVP